MYDWGMSPAEEARSRAEATRAFADETLAVDLREALLQRAIDYERLAIAASNVELPSGLRRGFH
jgi:hypothetical protein